MDCCSFLIAKHPETRGKLALIKELEKNLDIEKEILESIKTSEIIRF